ncbi:MAG: NfeD family protein, partial [Oscillospiraceae bacterium]
MEVWLVITWAIIAVVLTTAELLTTQLIAIWFAAGSLAAFVSALLGADFSFTLIIFVVVSVLLLILTRPITKKLIKAKSVPTNADAIINETAIVCEKIDNLSDTGRI